MSASAPAARDRRYGPAGLVLLALWGLIGLGLVWHLAASYDPDLVARFGPRFLKGLGTTLLLVACSFLAGAALSVPVALARMSARPGVGAPAFLFVYFFRGTPLIAQIFLVYYGLGQFRSGLESVHLWWFFREAWNCAVFSLALNTAAYQAEILRGAVESVPRGQWEGARALGLPRPVILLRVIAPQAMIVALRPYANEIILMVKASAIVAIITVFDLFGEAKLAYGRTLNFQAYLYAAIFYLVIVEALGSLVNVIERRLIRHLKR